MQRKLSYQEAKGVVTDKDLERLRKGGAMVVPNSNAVMFVVSVENGHTEYFLVGDKSAITDVLEGRVFRPVFPVAVRVARR